MSSKGYVAVVGIDFSEMSNKALDQALDLASLRTGEVHVVYVEPERPIETLLAGTFKDALSADTAVEQVRQRATERVGAVQSDHKLFVKRVVAHFRRGSPAEEIAQLAADLDADLVVVGSHGRRGVERALLGSVAERVSHLARCPVFIIRPKHHVGGERVPEIEPPCPECVKTREETHGEKFWCARHSEHHVRPHRYSYVSDGIVGEGSQAYESTPEHGA
jgi:nucleotide-binding universal stress UspA family protein